MLSCHFKTTAAAATLLATVTHELPTSDSLALSECVNVMLTVHSCQWYCRSRRRVRGRKQCCTANHCVGRCLRIKSRNGCQVIALTLLLMRPTGSHRCMLGLRRGGSRA
ncbi:hypothetical protein EJ03DRAFT_131347 [Teratosphaeria nubilosa]|uniref:Uncharacterized protein n=1 Tax=Teratosphaeria nubilosa TaxID=161662 RepID=A0A6G1LKK4_9PEZI|nr:hypothetical protein EJ03DRAFT_131347 [Teratosphaeria nubilosa]